MKKVLYFFVFLLGIPFVLLVFQFFSGVIAIYSENSKYLVSWPMTSSSYPEVPDDFDPIFLDPLVETARKRGYSQTEAEEIARLLFPLYERANFSGSGDPEEVYKRLTHFMQYFQIMMRESSGLGNPLYERILDVATHHEFSADVLTMQSQLKSLDRSGLFYACNYYTWIAAIIFEAQGFDVIGALTNTGSMAVEPLNKMANEKAILSIPDLSEKYLIYHVNVILTSPQKDSFFFDPVLNFVSKGFVIEDDYLKAIGSDTYKVLSSRADLYKFFEKMSFNNIVAGNYGNLHLYFKDFVTDKSKAAEALKRAAALLEGTIDGEYHKTLGEDVSAEEINGICRNIFKDSPYDELTPIKCAANIARFDRSLAKEYIHQHAAFLTPLNIVGVALVSLALNDHQKVIELLEPIVNDEFFGKGHAALFLASAYENVGRSYDAKLMYQMALEHLNPGHANVAGIKQALERL